MERDSGTTSLRFGMCWAGLKRCGYFWAGLIGFGWVWLGFFFFTSLISFFFSERLFSFSNPSRAVFFGVPVVCGRSMWQFARLSPCVV